MSITYTPYTVSARLQAVADAIDVGGNGSFVLYAGGTTVSTIALAIPCGTVNGNVLTFNGTLLDPSAANSGDVTTGKLFSGAGDLVAYGLSVGISGSGADIIISNGLNTTAITAGQTVQVLAAQIVGS